MVKNYKKKPVVIEALQWTGDNPEEVREFVGDSLSKNVDDYVNLIRLKLARKKMLKYSGQLLKIIENKA
ncbi:hypothetical protein H8D04_00500 [bacterium]|nr:hypothetical protein [bacterium]